MKDSKLRQLVKESIGSMLRSKMNLTAEDFLSLPDSTSDEAKLEAFKKAYSRGNTDSQTSLKTLLNQEPYPQLKSFVDMSDSAKSNKVSINVDPNRQFGTRSINEEQLRMQFLAGIITEAEYKAQLDEGLKDITAGVLIALSSLLGGKAIAQEISPINDFKQPTKFEITLAQSLKKNLENESTFKQTDTLLNTAADNIGGDELADDFEQLIVTSYYDDEGNRIGKDMRQKSRKDGVDTENQYTGVKKGSAEYTTLDYKKIGDQVDTSNKEVGELQNEIDQFLENMKKEIQAGKTVPEIEKNYMVKIDQLTDKINKLQEKYPRLMFNNLMKKHLTQEYTNKYILINVLNDFLDGKYDNSDAKLSFGETTPELGYRG
jgi:flagellar biosynthesis chaperone FliJ